MYDVSTASLYVFCTKDIDDEVYAELMDLMADIAKAIDTGYTQCVTQVALCHNSIYTQLRGITSELGQHGWELLKRQRCHV